MGSAGIDLGPFVAAIKNRQFKQAKEWLETKTAVKSKNEFLRGYLLALGGILSAAESSRELSAIRSILENDRKELGETLVEDFKKRLSQKFIPADEIGFMQAWIDFLQWL